jgi:ATP-dependent protease ClpP protease subunit
VNERPFRTTRRIANLRAGRNDWYRLQNSAGKPSVLHIYDEIGFFGVTAADLVRDLGGVSGDLEIHMNCPGGDVFEAVAIYNALAQRKGTVAVIVDGLAASAASFIAQAASPGHLTVAKTASMMIHDAFGMGIGNAVDMRQLADLLDQQSDNIAGIYADRSGKPVADWRAAMRAESWYVGQEAVDAGLADQVQGGAAPAATASFDLSIFAKSVTAAAAEPWDPDGDGDDDSTPEGDTDHDYWAPDGTQLKPVPGKPMTDASGQLVYAKGDGPGIRNAGSDNHSDGLDSEDLAALQEALAL